MAGNDLRLQVLLSAIDRVSGPFKKIMGGSSGVAKALRATRTELKQFEATQRNIDGFRKLESELATTSNKFTVARRELGRLSGEVNAAEAPTKKLIAALKKQGNEVGRLRELEDRHRTALAASKRTLDAAGISTSRLAVHERSLRSDISRANQALDTQTAKLQKMAATQRRMQKLHGVGMTAVAHGTGAVAAGTVAARGLMAPIAAYAKQEDAAAQLRASMMNAAGKVAPEYARIDALAQKLGNRLPGTTADFYEMMTMLRRQGMSAKVILGGLGEATGYLGVQLKMGYSNAAEFAAKLQDATQTTEKDMMSLSDVIQRTFYLGVDSDNMLQGITKLSPAMDVLKVKGLQAAKVFAPLLVMADQAGMKGEAAGNAYRKMFQGAMDAKKMSKANALIHGTGIKLDFTNGKGEFGGLDQMFVQLNKLKQLTTQDRLAVIKKIFGDDAETLQVVSLMISKGVAGYQQVQDKMGTQASLQQRVNSQLSTLKNLWDAASGTFVNGLAAMGEAVSPDLKKLTEWLGKVAEKLQIWAKENPKLSGGLLKISAVIVALLIGLGGLAIICGATTLLFTGLATAVTVLSGAIGLVGGALSILGTVIRVVSMALLTTPLGWVILALTAIAALAYLVYSNWDKIKPVLLGMWESIKIRLGEFWDWIKAKASEIWEGLKSIFAWTPMGMIVNNWTAILGFLGGLWTSFKEIGSNLLRGLVDGLLGGLTAVRDTITSIGGKVTGWFKEKLGIHSPSRVFAQLGGFTMQGFAGGLDRGQRRPLQVMDGFAARLRQAGAGAALGVATLPAMATGGPVAIDSRPPIAPRAAATAAAGPTYNITINAPAGAVAPDIARLVRIEIERLERERSARTRSGLSDYGD